VDHAQPPVATPKREDFALLTDCPALFTLLQYTAAVKTSSLDPTAKAIASLSTIVEKDAKLAAILSAPTLSAADKSAIVAELVKAAGIQGETVKNFLGTLAENNRLGLLPGVISKFGELISAARGEIEMVVTSAQVRI
jgi:F-type H+-transporting ATPase subunit O